MVHSHKLSFLSIKSILCLSSLSATLLFAQSQSSAQSQSAPPKLEYYFPVDGSRFVPCNTPIILRPTVPLDLASVMNGLIVTGSMTGRHTGVITVSDDGRTLLFTANEAFESGEHVQVDLGTGIVAKNDQELSPTSFSFEVQDNTPSDESPFLEALHPTNVAPTATAWNTPAKHTRAGSPMHTLSNDTLSLGIDSLSVPINNWPSQGYLFFSTFNSQAFFTDTGRVGANRFILDSNGNIVYHKPALDSVDWDFQPQPNGLMTFFSMKRNKWYAMDRTYTIVDSFWSSGGYPTDFHDFEILTHGHALMLSYCPIANYGLGKYPGGSDTTTFIGGVIEETDSLKRPYWIWRSWDPGHFLDTDATFDGVNENPFDAVHENSIQVDTDGNLLLSSRNLDEVSKISRKDGSFIWRLGGKHNQFKFIDDSIHFSHQHAVRRIANGNITLFDNGNYNHLGVRVDTVYDSTVGPPYYYLDTIPVTTFARACEYNVNAANMTANLTWHYDHDTTVPSTAMGNVQRLPNGNTLISWGLNPDEAAQGIPLPTVTEVTQDKRIVFEMDAAGQFAIYRAFKFPSPNYDTGFIAPAAPDTLLAKVSSISSIPNAPLLGSPYPNPANGSAIVAIDAAPSDRLELALYDPLGRQVCTYFTGHVSTPSFSVELQTRDLPNGAYELVLRGEGGTTIRQLVIVR